MADVLSEIDRRLALRAWAFADHWAALPGARTSDAVKWGNLVLETYDALAEAKNEAAMEDACDQCNAAREVAEARVAELEAENASLAGIVAEGIKAGWVTSVWTGDSVPLSLTAAAEGKSACACDRVGLLPIQEPPCDGARSDARCKQARHEIAAAETKETPDG